MKKEYFTKLVPAENGEMKMFLCTTEIEVGDKYYTSNSFDKLVSEPFCETGTHALWSMLAYKTFGRCDENATWIKEDMQFSEDDIEGYMWAGNQDQLGYFVLKQKY